MNIFAAVSVKSIGGLSLFDKNAELTKGAAQSYISRPSDLDEAKNKLIAIGFEVLSISASSISIKGSKDLFERSFQKELAQKSVSRIDGEEEKYFSAEDDAETLNFADPSFSSLIEGVALSIPPTYFSTAIPPHSPIHASAYRYLTVPDEVSMILRAEKIHRTGLTGKGVKVAMLDTGFYAHPFYSARGYRILPTKLTGAEINPQDDLNGHGTGEAANIFATAPDITLLPIKNGDAVDSFKLAVSEGANVITNSWGYDIDHPGMSWQSLNPYFKILAQEIQLAIDNGVIVCFAAGNGHKAFPASMPSVIAVGGVHVDFPSMDFEASSYASSFKSSIFPGRDVPDVCGLTGKRVNINGGKAPSLMLPVQPGAQLDSIDPTTGSSNDGWGLFSGTSAACPQIAGLCALLLQADSSRTQTDIKTILQASAIDVVQGTTATGDTATVGADLATGAGLAQA